ncbi:MAG: hypothetical protein LUC99_09815 [Clostridiales bacterium]|nr:hypothetical protein [Clostridiales bacterium]
MIYFETEIKHTDKTLEALARMQYNLFNAKTKIFWQIASVVLVFIGVLNFSAYWGILVAAAGCYMLTNIYAIPSHTAHQVSDQLKNSGMAYPHSRYRFLENEMEIASLPSGQRDGSLTYADVCKLGEDLQYFYLFRKDSGGYMISKTALGDKSASFRSFIEQKTGLYFSRGIPIVRFIRFLKRKRR